MTNEEQREKVIQDLTNLLRRNPFTVEFKVKKNPKGIRVIYEVTQEHLDEMMKRAAKKGEGDHGTMTKTNIITTDLAD